MTTKLTTLSNGMRIVTDTISHVETATLGVWVDAGARHESPQTNGAAHMLEHMAFKGTTKRSAQQIAEEIENVGGYLNAYTSREKTAYHARVLKEDVKLSLDIIADILQNSTFDATEFAKEQTVVLQEISQTNDTPDDIIFDFFQECCYPDHPLGRPILGTSELVKSFTPEMMKTFMKGHYGTHQMVVAAAGKVHHDEIVGYAEQFFQDLPTDLILAPEPAIYKGGTCLMPKDIEQVHMVYGFEGVPQGHKDYYAAGLFATILGGGTSSRLFQKIRENRGLVYSIYACHMSYRDTGQFAVYSGSAPEHFEEILPLVQEEIRDLMHTVTDEEISRAKAQITAGLMMGLESTTNRCEQVARQVRLYGKLIDTAQIRSRVENVTKKELCDLIDRLNQGTHSLAVHGPVYQIPGGI